ncbi:YihY/virulence factor BrkB family protein [Janibacter anophelis]|uniref:YihY/virulence factor BrkB family protein n=1 Tax=Janibacter anophelis TaxID=319054 RepID=UPI0008375232|nr:YihY/virulence factor BrkB family protein [Janibacter anophelis]
MTGRADRSGPAPHSEDSRAPDGPTDLEKPTLRHVLRRTAREFSADECTDLAAALTYYAVLALFPAFIALVSLVGLVGQGPQTVDTVLGVLRDTAGASVTDTLEPVLTSLAQGTGAGLALVLGLAGALWSASGYVNAFSRAMNRIYGVTEGRPVWKLRPLMLLVTAVLLVLVAAVLVALVVSGPVAESIGSLLGLGSSAVTVWQIAKWPVLLLAVVVIVALLYWSTPNVRQPKIRWMSPGALVAILVWVLASVAFGIYVANFGSYNKTYGSMAGVIVFLLWLWLTNLALLFGAELDAELERGRELQAGMPAEDEIQLPRRDTTGIDKKKDKHEEDVRDARALRRRGHGRTDRG